ncbi:hypothetical protein A3752_06030 [Oleiphilus sp. HI0081]|jgi:type IV pilus assembly protein PilX|uniref:pilus assembly PilX family protein n=2 Tax=Oleiphilus TaxID=141450 RepID=UPI0007C3D8AD|nr:MULTISPECIES: PilX N-terminal domain-containing pilus assembly protein [unclassified Oleiphilus]KZY86670.1 hypothetical protein A3743_16610 [Oleiphilus sp. HI0072]KZZ13760.1 hypothetical protein A3749_26050 [Oleiphilus sp. HI0078]KZZ22647.1 hypothetical protein A3752_06030 [Oleiphilus sp. HI0081]KZY30693.1 hypothetical protein A3729_01110 [Oleiphilus sp. HI0043]KZY89003.1 hypothetical protein A3743_09665 [Oleiphilus sp. HI0072]
MKTRTHQTLNNIPRQQGAALVISLIILIVMTLVGVSSMSTSLVQEKMAANAQNTNITFQAAESSVGGLLLDLTNNQDALTDTMGEPGTRGEITSYDIEAIDVSADYQVTYLGEVILSSGSSLDADEGSTDVKAQRFDVAATGRLESTNAQTVLRQGIEYY